MKLLKLSANKNSFRPVIFNKEGISLITGRRKSSSDADTYNSVGKSLMIYLIHFCLGLKKSNALEEKLPDWLFRLDFEIKGATHYSSRSTSKQNKIVYDGEELSLKDYWKILGQEIFGLDEDNKSLSFRSLITRFIRNGKAGYVSFDQFMSGEQDDKALLNTSFLLGLDFHLALAKIQYREEFVNIQKQEKNLDKDSSMKEVLLHGDVKNVDVDIMNLERDITKLSTDIENFEIASDYGIVKKEADDISKGLSIAKNESFKYQMFLDSIEKSLSHKPDISKDRLLSFFEEAQVSLADIIVKRIEDVERFNKGLIEDRRRILLEQKKEYLRLLDEAKKKVRQLEKEENEKLQYLNSHGALEDFVKLTSYLSDKKISLERLNQYKELHSQYSVRKEEIKKAMAEENIKTQQYLDSNVDLTKKIVRCFHDYANKLYGEKGASLTIENNDGENKLRYNINAHIPADAGDGVSGAKMFCFDWTLMSACENRFVDCLVHDSRLMSETDPRQIASMLQIAFEETNRLKCQYILTLNESTIENLKMVMTPEEFKEIVEDNQVLELNDDSDEGKLLGIQVDLEYE